MLNFGAFFFILASFISFSTVSGVTPHRQNPYPLNFILGSKNLGPLSDGILGEAQAPAPGPAFYEPKVPLVLAGNRTKRPDILRKFRVYQGGWDISNKHYWASVAFTGVAGFIITLVWLVTFGAALFFHHFLGWRISFKGKGSPLSQNIHIVLLLLFSCASIVGCIILSVGQLEVHKEVLQTLKYVVNQSDYTAQMLRNVSDYLSIAKSVDVPQFKLPQNTLQEIDEIGMRLDSGAETLTNKTSKNTAKVRKVFNTVRSALITVASVMLVLAILGLVLPLLGCQNVIHIFTISGCILVAVTVILCGTFMIFNSAILDARVAMQQWVDNPQAETSLSNILPCVDENATNRTLSESREVVSILINTVNTFIYTAANTDRPPSDQFYYNQSGPSMPTLCYPFDSNMRDRECSPQEVSMENASTVWARYICATSLDDKNCTTPGRLTSDIYGQLVLAANASYAVLHYTPAMLNLQNCNFLRDTFVTITSKFFPPLERYIVIVIVGLGFISAGIMASLILWLVYANRPQREEAFAKTPSIRGSSHENKDEAVSKVSLVVTSPSRVVPDIEK